MKKIMLLPMFSFLMIPFILFTITNQKTSMLSTSISISGEITTSTRTPRPTIRIPVTETPNPTLSADKAKQTLEKMNDKSCILPCFLGITPGRTTYEEARNILIGLGHTEYEEYITRGHGYITKNFEFIISDRENNERTNSQSVNLVIDDDVVQVIIAFGGTIGPESTPTSIYEFRRYWHRYMVREVFHQLGKPDDLSVPYPDRGQRGDSLIIFYNNHEDIAIEIYGMGSDNHLCPEIDATGLYTLMYISYPESTIDKYDVEGGIPLTNRELYAPIEELYDVSLEDFYNKVMMDPAICFKPKQSLASPTIVSTPFLFRMTPQTITPAN